MCSYQENANFAAGLMLTDKIYSRGKEEKGIIAG